MIRDTVHCYSTQPNDLYFCLSPQNCGSYFAAAKSSLTCGSAQFCLVSADEKVLHEPDQYHEALRTSFFMHKGKPVQKILDKVAFEVDFSNMSDNTEKFKNKLDVNSLVKDFIKPFKLDISPLFRIKLVKTEEKQGYR